jgi:hypothetical protein
MPVIRVRCFRLPQRFWKDCEWDGRLHAQKYKLTKQVLLATFRMERNKAKRSRNADPAAVDQIPRRIAQSLEDITIAPEALVPSRLPLAVRDD